MTDNEVQPWIGKAVGVTLTDASIVAGHSSTKKPKVTIDTPARI
jgi:hypothetical protein